MKLQKGDKAIVLDAIGVPSSLIGQQIRVLGVLDDGRTCWCQAKQGGRFYLNASALETIRVHRRKERKRRRIAKLQKQLEAI